MKTRTILSVLALCMIVISCGRIDNSGPVSISFSEDIYEATFYVSGQTEAITITSEIEGEPDITLDPETHPSISYDAATGAIEWTRELPLGPNTVIVIATLESAEARTEVTIDNRFQGAFSGGYNFNPESSLNSSFFNSVQFNSDGTMTLVEDGDDLGIDYEGSGSWVTFAQYNEAGNETVIEFTYSYDTAPDTFYTFSGALTYDETEAYISGSWYNGSAVEEGEERGNFNIGFQE